MSWGWHGRWRYRAVDREAESLREFYRTKSEGVFDYTQCCGQCGKYMETFTLAGKLD